MKREVRKAWVLVTREEDAPHIWVAHCLELDIVSQGDSIEHAFEAVLEAVAMAVHDDLADGLDPFKARKEAPQDDWDRLFRLLRSGVPLESVPSEMRSKISCVAAQLKLTIEKPASAPKQKLSDPLSKLVPPLWQIAALENLRGPDSQRC